MCLIDMTLFEWKKIDAAFFDWLDRFVYDMIFNFILTDGLAYQTFAI
jgi:hypothetical protein